MRNFLIKAVLGLFVMLVICAASPQQAEAVKVKMTNPFSKPLFMAIKYRDDNTWKWIVQGWYKVEPNSTKTFNFPNSTKMEYVNIYAHTSDNSWESNQGNIHGSDKLYVISNAFKYYEDEGCPAGNKRRQVMFAMGHVGANNIVNWKP